MQVLYEKDDKRPSARQEHEFRSVKSDKPGDNDLMTDFQCIKDALDVCGESMKTAAKEDKAKEEIRRVRWNVEDVNEPGEGKRKFAYRFEMSYEEKR